MSKESFSVPNGQAARYDFQHSLLIICKFNAVAWGIPAEKITIFEAKCSDYEQKYSITNNRSTQSPAATAARDAAWAIVAVEIEDIYNHYLLNNDAISASDKMALHITTPSGRGGASTPPPTTMPIVNMIAENTAVLRIVFTDSNTTGTHSKPDTVAFCELCYKFDAPAPVTPDECAIHQNISRSNELLVFETDKRGKTLYGYARWVNRNGKVGPWSGQFTAIVP